MSEKDKKLLVYLGALLILAGAYFFVGKPYLDKIDNLAIEKMQLESELNEKRKAFSNYNEYQSKIAESERKVTEILDKFPPDNSDEKSTMFIVNMEKDLPVWVGQIKYAEIVENLVNGQESASAVEQQALEDSIEANDEEYSSEQVVGNEAATMTSTSVDNYIGRDTEIALAFASDYDAFKQMIDYIRDYKDRMVIKNIDVKYTQATALVEGNIVLAQYAIYSGDREIPDVETGVDELGTSNIFSSSSSGKSILGTIISDIANAGNENEGENVVEMIEDADYFVRLAPVTDNTEGIVVGKCNDVPGETYVVSNENKKQTVRLEFVGKDGKYSAVYSVGNKTGKNDFEKDSDGVIRLKISSRERVNNDEVVATFHITNSTDIPLEVTVEGDDSQSPRVIFEEKNGNITVNE